MQQVTVRVPASTSNLGPGFDCLGVALRVYNSVTIVRGGKHFSSRIVDEAARLFFKRSSAKSFSYGSVIIQGVPRSRGLGSSATLRVGALFALNRLAGNPLDRLSIFRLCAELEGHPDNAAPSIFGGFTVVRGENVQRFDVSPRLHFVLAVPDIEIKTSAARKILPARINRAAAVESCGNACAITAAFASRNYRDLRENFGDRLHQPFREKLIPFLPRVIAAAEKAGALGAFLSGSGSIIAAVTLRSPKKIADVMLRAIRPTSARLIITTADNHGARILQIRNPKSEIQNSSGPPD
jgi:homoserine kinase